MLKRLGRWFVVVLVVAGLAGPALAQKSVKIGVLTPLSPPGDASAGQFIVRGAKMGAEAVNARGGVLGGRQIELVVEDDAGTPAKGVAGLRKLATQDQVAAVIGQFHSSVMGAVQTLAEQFPPAPPASRWCAEMLAAGLPCGRSISRSVRRCGGCGRAGEKSS